MSLFRLTRAARDDLRALHEYIALDNRAAADRVVSHLETAMAKLAEHPHHLGHVRDDLSRAPLRFWQVFSYLTVYRPDRSPIEVFRVLHTFRDVRNLLAG